MDKPDSQIMPQRTTPHCVFCGKVTATHEGLKRHIAGRPDCQRQWALMIKDIDTENLDALNRPDSPPSADFSHHVHPHPSADMDNNPAPRKTPRVTVEEAEDDDGTQFSYTGRFFEPQEDAGWTLREGETKFEGYKRDQEEGSEHPWAPFEDA